MTRIPRCGQVFGLAGKKQDLTPLFDPTFIRFYVKITDVIYILKRNAKKN